MATKYTAGRHFDFGLLEVNEGDDIPAKYLATLSERDLQTYLDNGWVVPSEGEHDGQSLLHAAQDALEHPEAPKQPPEEHEEPEAGEDHDPHLESHQVGDADDDVGSILDEDLPEEEHHSRRRGK